ncbi:unnamed protein product [Acanthoscelides obtectus]|uniref:Uncharacterized protein n=1 Tax=Acanthoscelides obtectus TaxID=200917 RepID=A0A9P0LUH1_ACAOB|nr:unnamed protein product [Acanthoscelides obtectus]CAK1678408.1 hypothetical protein AOBTE_LOCUS31878 [Acanthoscelides obtectus]
MEENNEPLLNWGSSSPDLSHIETLWHEMKKVLRQHPTRTIVYHRTETKASRKMGLLYTKFLPKLG